MKQPYSVHLRLRASTCRRVFLSDNRMGFTRLALVAMLAHDGIIRAAESDRVIEASRSLAKPKAKSVIWIFLIGGMSHLESFDPKPELNKHAGKTIDES